MKNYIEFISESNEKTPKSTKTDFSWMLKHGFEENEIDENDKKDYICNYVRYFLGRTSRTFKKYTFKVYDYDFYDTYGNRNLWYAHCHIEKTDINGLIIYQGGPMTTMESLQKEAQKLVKEVDDYAKSISLESTLIKQESLNIENLLDSKWEKHTGEHYFKDSNEEYKLVIKEENDNWRLEKFQGFLIATFLNFDDQFIKNDKNIYNIKLVEWDGKTVSSSNAIKDSKMLSFKSKDECIKKIKDFIKIAENFSFE